MTDEQFARALSLAVSLLGLWALFYFGWRECLTASLRFELSAIRNDLSAWGKAGHLNVQHPAYELLARRLDAVIRYANRLTFARLASAMLLDSRRPLTPPLFHQWQESLGALPKTTADELRKFEERMAERALFYIALRSPFLLLAFPLFAPRKFRGQFRRSLEALRRSGFVNALARAVRKVYASLVPGLKILEAEAVALARA
jgi:hypothetical protein